MHHSRQPEPSMTTTVRDRLLPGQEAGATGRKIAAFDGETSYVAIQLGEVRHGWTERPDRQGRYHALTLQIAEDGTTWKVTADQPFETRGEARSWAERLAAETGG